MWGRYREQAAQDADWVLRRVQEHSQQLGPRKVMPSLENNVKSFCKNAHALRVVKGKSIVEEYKGSINLSEIGINFLVFIDITVAILFLKPLCQSYLQEIKKMLLTLMYRIEFEVLTVFISRIDNQMWYYEQSL